MSLTPLKIYQDLKENKLDRKSAAEILLMLIENSEDDDVRIESIKLLEKIGFKNDKLFKVLEGLLISDLNERVRYIAAVYITDYFIDRALSPMKWALEYESNYDCLILIIKTLAKIGSNEAKETLLDDLKRIKKRKYIDKDRQYHNKFKKSLKKLLKSKKIKNLHCEDLADIIINYKTIETLIKTFYTIYYKVENGLVTELDLSDLGWNVNVWRQKYAEKVEEISEIVGLMNLKNLKSLDLSNNRISFIKDLLNLKKLTHLYISNNKLNLDNIEFFEKMDNLKFLDIHGNEIATSIKFLELRKKLDVKLKSNLLFE
ncbi:MAG: leucine-rich repeat domain-containing protein [Promethearchaeota archaeon]